MRLTNVALTVALGGVALACATPPPPEDPSSSGLALHLDARSPVKILPAEIEQVLFVRLDEGEDDPLLGTSIFYSNYSEDGYFYLLNPPPGSYVAVAAVTSAHSPVPGEPPRPPSDDPLDPGNFPSPAGHQSFDWAIYFDEDLVRQTEVTARPGSLSFVGEFRVQTSVLRGTDSVQSHYLRLLQPGESENIVVQALLHSSGIYSGRAAAVERGAPAHERFSSKASEHLMSAGWGEMLKGAAESPTP